MDFKIGSMDFHFKNPRGSGESEEKRLETPE
jgi:hypothetical protein